MLVRFRLLPDDRIQITLYKQRSLRDGLETVAVYSMPADELVRALQHLNVIPNREQETPK